MTTERAREIAFAIVCQRDKKSFEFIKSDYNDIDKITLTWMSKNEVAILPYDL